MNLYDIGSDRLIDECIEITGRWPDADSASRSGLAGDLLASWAHLQRFDPARPDRTRLDSLTAFIRDTPGVLAAGAVVTLTPQDLDAQLERLGLEWESRPLEASVDDLREATRQLFLDTDRQSLRLVTLMHFDSNNTAAVEQSVERNERIIAEQIDSFLPVYASLKRIMEDLRDLSEMPPALAQATSKFVVLDMAHFEANVGHALPVAEQRVPQGQKAAVVNLQAFRSARGKDSGAPDVTDTIRAAAKSTLPDGQADFDDLLWTDPSFPYGKLTLTRDAQGVNVVFESPAAALTPPDVVVVDAARKPRFTARWIRIAGTGGYALRAPIPWSEGHVYLLLDDCYFYDIVQ